MDIRKKVYRYTWIYMGTILLVGIVGTVLSVFTWGKVAIAVLMVLFGIWSSYICRFFFRARKEFIPSDTYPLSYISWGYQWKRIVGSAILAGFTIIIGLGLLVFSLTK